DADFPSRALVFCSICPCPDGRPATDTSIHHQWMVPEQHGPKTSFLGTLMVRDVRTNEAGSGESHWGERESVIRQGTGAVKQKLDNSISLAALINMAWEAWRAGFSVTVRQVHGTGRGDERRVSTRFVMGNTVIRERL